MGWRAPVAAAALVLAVSLTSGVLYRSSTATAALRHATNSTCPADVGFLIGTLPHPGVRLDLTKATSLNEIAASIHGTEPPLIETTSESVPVKIPGQRPGVEHRAVALRRQGQEQLIAPNAAPLTGDEVLVPAAWADAVGVHAGDELELGGGRLDLGTGDPTPVHVAGTYADLSPDDPTDPWCGVRTLFTPGPFGDPPTPVFLAGQKVIDELDVSGIRVSSTWELHIAPGATTEDQAPAIAAAMAAIPSQWSDFDDNQSSHFYLKSRPGSLDRFAVRASAAGEVVGRSVAPVQAAAVVASLAVLIGVGVLVAVRRRAELELLVQRGAPAHQLVGRVGRTMVVPAVAGAAGGVVVALLGIRAFAPAAVVSDAARGRAIVLGVVAAAGTAIVVTLVATVRTTRSVDPAPGRSWLRWLPWELAPCALALVSWQRLQDAGGARLSGVDVRGHDGLAQAFPVLLAGALLAVVVRPLLLSLRRGRLAGRRLPLAVRLGVRRVTAQPSTTAVIVLAGALAAATFATGVLLRDTAAAAEQQKAATYVGADLAIDTAGAHELPASLAGRATVTTRVDAIAGDRAVDLLAIDPTTFADGATSLDGQGALASLVQQLSAGAGPAPAIVVGGSLPSATITAAGVHLDVRTVATRDAFPGLRGGAVLVVVDRAALGRAPLTGTEQVWLRAPTATARADLQAAGFPVYGSASPAQVFDAISFLVIAWSFAGMQAFGLVVGSLVVLIEVLVLHARRRQRQVAWVLTQRMGVDASRQRTALFVELAIPVAAAVTLGIAVAIGAAWLAAGPLDALPDLQPAPRLVVHVGALLAIVAASLLVLIALAAAGTADLRATDPLEVVRSEQ